MIFLFFLSFFLSFFFGITGLRDYGITELRYCGIEFLLIGFYWVGYSDMVYAHHAFLESGAYLRYVL